MSRLARLMQWLPLRVRPLPPSQKTDPLPIIHVLDDTEDHELKRLIAETQKPVVLQAEPDIDVPISRGRVIRHTKKPTYKSGKHGKGGRIVKAMPRELRKVEDLRNIPMENDDNEQATS